MKTQNFVKHNRRWRRRNGKNKDQLVNKDDFKNIMSFFSNSVKRISKKLRSYKFKKHSLSWLIPHWGKVILKKGQTKIIRVRGGRKLLFVHPESNLGKLLKVKETGQYMYQLR